VLAHCVCNGLIHVYGNAVYGNAVYGNAVYGNAVYGNPFQSISSPEGKSGKCNSGIGKCFPLSALKPLLGFGANPAHPRGCSVPQFRMVFILPGAYSLPEGVPLAADQLVNRGSNFHKERSRPFFGMSSAIPQAHAQCDMVALGTYRVTYNSS
jgi:hypothetical protein